MIGYNEAITRLQEQGVASERLNELEDFLTSIRGKPLTESLTLMYAFSQKSAFTPEESQVVIETLLSECSDVERAFFEQASALFKRQT